MMSGVFPLTLMLFQDFPLHDENEETIDSYQIKHLKEHHELYNIRLGHVSKKLNDKKEEDHKAEEGHTGNMQEIIVGPVEENGKDLPSGKNLGDYINEKGRMDVLKFFEDHKKYFPTLWIIAQREAAR